MLQGNTISRGSLASSTSAEDRLEVRREEEQIAQSPEDIETPSIIVSQDNQTGP